MEHDQTDGTVYSLSWDAVEPSTDAADVRVTYYIYQEFGLDAFVGSVDAAALVDISSASFSTEETEIALKRGNFEGSRCFIVYAYDNYAGLLSNSDVECHNFLHHLTGEAILRADGDGTQRGVDQKWTFTYSLDTDAYFTARIYPPGTLFTRDANRFIIGASNPPTKILAENIPRSGELANHSITMEETWDSRSSSGAVVSNGIYYLVMSASLDAGQLTPVPSEAIWLSSTTETLLRGTTLNTVPVDILRIMNLAATGITLSNPTSQISYFLTGDALVRLVIAQPGSGFIVDSSGDIQPYNLVSDAVDQGLVVSTFSFQRKAGSNNEAWNGISSSGTVMPSGVYAVGISARDEYGNTAISASGDSGPIFTTITLERSAGSEDGEDPGSGTDGTIPTLTSISPAAGSTVVTALSTVTIVVADDTAISANSVDVTISGPNGNITTQATRTNTQNSAGAATITFVFNPPLEENGAYTITYNIVDTSGNETGDTTSTFAISIGLASNAFESSLILYPNPAKATPANIGFALGVDSTVTIDIFNILGEKVWSTTQSRLANANDSIAWPLVNGSGQKVGSGLYLVRVKANGGGAAVESTKKLVIIQ